METSNYFSSNTVLLLISILLFIIFLLLSFLFPKSKYEKLNILFHSLAFICMPAFLIGITDRLFLINYFLKDTENVIEEKLIDPFGDYLGNYEKYGLKSIHPPIDFNIIFNQVEKGGEIKLFDTFIPEIHNTFPSLKAALARNVEIKILVAHPEAQITKFRAEEIGPEWDYYKSFRPAIYGYISHIEAIVAENYSDWSKLVEVRYYEDLTSVPLYIVDNPGDNNDKCYQGYFLANASVELPCMEYIKTKTGLYNAFLQYFDEKWERNSDNVIDLSNFSGHGSLPKCKFSCDDINNNN